MTTQHQTFKYIFFISILLGMFLIKPTVQPVYAMQCDTIADISNGSVGPEQIICPIARVVNIFIYAAVAVLIIMLLFGGLKLALAMGDSKGFLAAMETWKWAIVGFLIVVGSITLLTVISRFLGWNINFANPYEFIYNEIMNFRIFLGIS